MKDQDLVKARDLKGALENNNATTVQFCGLHAADYLSGIKPLFDLEEEEERLKIELEGVKQKKVNARLVVRDLNRRMVDGIRCSPDYGPNSALYVQAGYVAHNQRRSGLTRSPVETPPIAPLTPPSGQAAA